jgi:tRNA(Ile)-lysidine synthase
MADSRRLRRLSEEVLAAARIPAGPCVVALSGGADSAVCAWAALQMRRPVRAVHVDHRLEGSPMMRSAAVAVAERLGVALRIVEVSVDDGPSPENAAREARYRALGDALEPGELLLTGHIRGDQAETVLGNLLRGAGLDGLAGIPGSRGRIVRPLLDVTRAQTRELASLLGLPWVEDPANLEEGPRRNLLRREIIPFLEARTNPSLEAALARTATTLARERDLAERLADRVVYATGAGTATLPAPLLETIHPALAARIVRRALRSLAGPHAGTLGDVDRVMRVVVGTESRAELTGGVHVERVDALVVLDTTDEPSIPAPVEWRLPGAARYGTWLLASWISDVPPAAFPPGRFVEVFDAAALPDAATVRPTASGDTISLVTGHKSVAVSLSEARVSPRKRSSWPVMVAGADVVWVPGVRRADLGWVDAATKRYLWVRATREDA